MFCRKECLHYIVHESILRTPGEGFWTSNDRERKLALPHRMHEALSCLMLPWSLKKAERSLWIKEAFSLGSGLTHGISESQAFAYSAHHTMNREDSGFPRTIHVNQTGSHHIQEKHVCTMSITSSTATYTLGPPISCITQISIRVIYPSGGRNFKIPKTEKQRVLSSPKAI